MKKVLYVEDEDFFAKTVSNKLEEAGFQVDLASDGENGIKMLQEKTYDLVLLDLVLPRKDGFEVLKEMKNSPHNKVTPVIILSNLFSDSDKHKAEDLGVHEFCLKMTSTPGKILTLVQTTLGVS